MSARRAVHVAGVTSLLAAFVIARGFSFDAGAAALGAFTGLTYGVLAVGLVLVFRSSRFINFAHGDIGFLGATVMVTLVTRAGVPYWLAFVLGLLAAALAGAATEATVVRRLRNAPRLMSMIATLILGRVLLGFSLAANTQAATGYLYPQPAGFGSFQIGALRATQAHLAMLVLTPIVALGLAAFLRRSRFGLAIRAAAANPDDAAMSGVLPARMATAAWALAGAVAAFTAMLWLPTRVLAVGQFGPSLLVRALAAAVIGRMTSIPVAFAAGVGLGIVEQIVVFNAPGGGGEIEMWLFAIILVTLLLQSRQQGRLAETGSWAAVQPWRPLPTHVAALRSVRLAKAAGALLAVAVALAALLVINNEQAFVLEITMAFVLVGVSVGLVTGVAGQLSLGQFAIAGMGAIAAFRTAETTGSLPLAFAAAALAGAVAAVVVGLPALRLRGLLLAVTTLSFAVAAGSWIFSQEWAFSGGVSRPVVDLLGLSVASNRSYYPIALGAVVIGFWLARNVRGSSLGRGLVALRDNEDAARAFTIPATARKLQAFAVSGVLAGLGGAVYAFAVPNLEAGLFPADANIDAVTLTLIGGVAVLGGPVLGALYLVAMARFVFLDVAMGALHTLGALVIILALPNGVISLVAPLRERFVRLFDARDADGAQGAPAAISLTARVPSQPPAADARLLVVDDVRKAYGGVVAVDGVSLDVAAGETVGLIGPNGAGKTTLFEIISGFVPADAGTITFDGRDVTGAGPEARGRLGLVRSFQEASLFGTMTLLDTVRTAHERVLPSRVWAALSGVDPLERRREAHARELLALMGLDGFRDRVIGELSTGVRRLAEITCLLALEPRLLLLDEPAAGVAQRETEQLGAVLAQVKRHLSCTLVVIEHDLPLISEISDRVVAMDAGRILVTGTPAEVVADSRVAQAFLGGDVAAVARSGTRSEPLVATADRVATASASRKEP